MCASWIWSSISTRCVQVARLAMNALFDMNRGWRGIRVAWAMILTTCAGSIGLRNPGRSLSRRRDSRDKQAGRSHAIGTPGQVGVEEANDTRIRERYGTVADYGPDCIGQIKSKQSFAWSFRCIGGFQTILVLFMFILGGDYSEISNHRCSSCRQLGVPQSVCCQAFPSYSLSASVPHWKLLWSWFGV